MNLCRTAAISALVALSFGFSVLSVLPFIRPLPHAYCIAPIAYSEILSKSLYESMFVYSWAVEDARPYGTRYTLRLVVGDGSRLPTRSNRKTIATGNLRPRPPVRCSLNRTVIRFICVVRYGIVAYVMFDKTTAARLLYNFSTALNIIESRCHNKLSVMLRR